MDWSDTEKQPGENVTGQEPGAGDGAQHVHEQDNGAEYGGEPGPGGGAQSSSGAEGGSDSGSGASEGPAAVAEPGAAQELATRDEGGAAAAQEPAADTEGIASHLFAIRTTGGQEKVVMRLLEAKANANKINIQSVMLVDNLKGYVVVEAVNPSDAYMALEGIRHIRGQLRGELSFKDIEGYLVKKSTVSQLAVDNVIEITGGPFKGMKATITRIDAEKEEATVVLLDASYQLPVTVDANYLKLATGA